jgi:hypothetical protein
MSAAIRITDASWNTKNIRTGWSVLSPHESTRIKHLTLPSQQTASIPPFYILPAASFATKVCLLKQSHSLAEAMTLIKMMLVARAGLQDCMPAQVVFDQICIMRLCDISLHIPFLMTRVAKKLWRRIVRGHRYGQFMPASSLACFDV